MPYDIYYGCERPVSTPLYVVIMAKDRKSIKIDKLFFRIASKAAKNLGMTKLTIQLMGQNVFRERRVERSSCEEEFEIRYPFREMADIHAYNSENIMLAHISRKAICAEEYGLPLSLIYDESEMQSEKGEGKEKSALYDLLCASKEIMGIDLEICLSESMRPRIPDDEIAEIQDIIRNGIPPEQKDAECGCPYRVTEEGCHICSRRKATDVNLHFDYADTFGKTYISYDIESELRKNRAKVQKELKKMESNAIQYLCSSKATKISQKALQECNIERKTWNGVFDLDYQSERNSILAVAVGMKLEWKKIKRLMKLKGFAMDPNIRCVDAVVGYYCNKAIGQEKEGKKDYCVDNINTTLADLGSAQFLGGKKRDAES